MNAPDSKLLRALTLSQQILSLAERAELREFGELDAERGRLLRDFRQANRSVGAADGAVLQQIAELNDRALGQLLHHQRAKARQIDIATVGRRAVAADSSLRR